MRLIFMGTPQFALPSLEALINSGDFKPVAVVTAPDKPVGREQTLAPPPVKTLAEKHQIPVLQPEKIRNNGEFFEKLKSLAPDIIVVAAYGKIIPKEIIELPQHRTINVHASLLPKYRGPSPIQSAILEGEKTSGITIMLIDEKMDTGPILSQEEITLDSEETAATLHDKLSMLGASLLLKTLPGYTNGQIKPQAQDDSLASYCKMITRDDGKIIWSNPASDIERQIRAFTPWPGAFTFYEYKDSGGHKINKRIKISKAKAEQASADLGEEKQEYGKIFFNNEKLVIQTGDGRLSVAELQPEGGNPMSAKEFINGYQKMDGVVLK